MAILLNFLLVIFLAAFAYLAYHRLDRAVLFIIAGTPLYLIRFKFLGLPCTVIEAMILIAFLGWLASKDGINIKEAFRKSWSHYPYRWEMILLILVALGGVVTAGINKEALGIFKAYFLEPILLFIMAFDLFRDRTGRKKIIFSLAISALLVSLFAIYQKITGQFISNPFWSAAATRRAVSFFGYPNAVGLFLAPLIMIFSGYFVIDKNKKERLFLALTIISSLLAIIFAQSEGALIGLAAGIFVFALLANKKSRLIILLLAVIGLGTIAAYQPLRHLAIQKATLEDLSGQIRRQQWKETWQMLTDGRLIQGAGLSNYQKTIAPYHQAGIFLKNDDPKWLNKIMFQPGYREKMWQPTEIYMYPHNIILNFWSELGLAGVLLFIWIISKFLYQSIAGSYRLKDDRERYLALGLATAMVVMIIHGLVDVPYFKNDLSLLFWVNLALLSSLTFKKHEKNLTENNR